MNNDDLDRLLAAPLSPVADNGFAAGVMARIQRSNEPQHWLEVATITVAAGFVLALLSAAGFSEWAARIGASLATSIPFAMAALALALTWSSARIFSD